MKCNSKLAFAGLLLAGLIFGANTKPVFAGEVWEQKNYSQYKEEISGFPVSEKSLFIEGSAASSSENTYIYQNNGKNALFTDETGFAEWVVDIEQGGLFNIIVDYETVESKGNDIMRALYIDGEIPFAEASGLTFSRVYTDEGEIKRDSHGNDIRPRQLEKFVSKSTYLKDAAGYYTEPLVFYFSEGKHTLQLTSIKEAMGVHSLVLVPVQELPSYEEVKNQYEINGYTYSEQSIKVEAELAYEKSSPSIYPLYDRGSPLMTPYSTGELRFNSIGREKWQESGTWISWKITVPEDGLYKIVTRYKQDTLGGIYVNRELRIDGSIPFEEAKGIRFNSRDGWHVQAFGNEEEDYLFYFAKGEHEITLEVTLGDLAEVIMQIEESLFTLNEVYRDIVMITGTSPDLFRDYYFENVIPDSVAALGEQAEILNGLSEEMVRIVGGKGRHIVAIDKVSFDLTVMHNQPERIAAKLTSFKDNMGALASWVYETKKQALELDWIQLYQPNEKLPKSEAGFFSILLHNIMLFFSSFGTDYYEVNDSFLKEAETGKNISVWVGTGSIGGRDQAQIIRQMIDDSFTPESGINVNVQLVAPGTLLPATLAGTGPDIALQIGGSDPVNYAIRGAVTDLSVFDGFNEVTEQFNPNALTPYTFNGGVYALPETYSFNMLFCRTDVLSELSLDIPKTWEDVYTIIPELQKRGMNIGIPASGNTLGTYAIFLYQNGLDIYDMSTYKTRFTEKEYIYAFNKLTDFFCNYKIPLEYDFVNRFRTGEMPVAIADYTTYNQLSVFAPEIRGRWIMTDIPGTVGEDGTINSTTTAAGNASIIMSAAKDKQSSWEFLKWWTGAEASSRFGRELESLLGRAGRYNPANKYAMEKLPWSVEEYENIMSQWNNTMGIPEVPGGYITPRYINFAFRAVVGDKKENPGEQLLKYNKEITFEIERKLKEFNLQNN